QNAAKRRDYPPAMDRLAPRHGRRPNTPAGGTLHAQTRPCAATWEPGNNITEEANQFFEETSINCTRKPSVSNDRFLLLMLGEARFYDRRVSTTAEHVSAAGHKSQSSYKQLASL